ncbi:MAG: M48 family metalloprotease [Comamonas sp.]
MDPLVYPREKTLGTLTLVLGIVVWLLLVVGTFGVALAYVLLGFIAYLFAQSGLIAWLRGTGVKLSEDQLPELYLQYLQCCQKLGITDPPEAYVLQGDGMMNAFATRFLGRNYVIVLADTLDALRELPDGINFYFGHELGHIRRGHLTGHIWRAPVLWLPLLGAAYSRAKEYTCDLHGRACCEQPESAARALAVLAAGAEKWQQVNLATYARQTLANRGFFPDFHELIGGYPWLTKRVVRMLNPDTRMPGRNPFSYLLAFFVPYGGRVGGGAAGLLTLLLVIAAVGALVAVGLPELQRYQERTQMLRLWHEGAALRSALGDYYEQKQEVPDNLPSAGVTLAQAGQWEYDSETMSLNIPFAKGTFAMVPSEQDGKVIWHCSGSGPVAKSLPDECREDADEDLD